MVLICKTLSPFHPKMHKWFCRRRSEDFVNIFSLYCNNIPLEKGMVQYFNKLESPLPKDVLCKVWLKLALWFLNGQQVFRKAHLSFELRWAKNKYVRWKEYCFNSIQLLFRRMDCFSMCYRNYTVFIHRNQWLKSNYPHMS